MNETEEFRQLYDECKSYCFSVLLKFKASPEDVEDAFSEAMSIYWIRLKQGKLKNRSNIKAYICTIALNYYRTKAKEQSQKVSVDQIELEKISDDLNIIEVFPSSPNKKFQKAFALLSDNCQKMLLFKYVYAYTYEDMAEDMGRKSANGIKVQTFRCAKYLLKHLQNKNSGDEFGHVTLNG